MHQHPTSPTLPRIIGPTIGIDANGVMVEFPTYAAARAWLRAALRAFTHTSIRV